MADALIAKEFAGYRIDSRVGRGGMGVVYRATDLSLDRTVALKVLAEDVVSDPDFRRRFVSESKLAASLDHPYAGERLGEFKRGRRNNPLMIDLM